MRITDWKSSIQVLVMLAVLTTCQSQDDIKLSVKLDPEEEIRFSSDQMTETKRVRQQYDYIVVGAGSAGCVVANRLSEISTARVLLIEAGGYESLKMDVPAEDIALPHTHVDWQYETEKCQNCGFGAAVKQRFSYPRGKVVGGCSTINGMMYTRGSPGDFDMWEEKYGNPGWSFRNVEKYFKKLENYSIFDLNNRNYFGRNGPLYVSDIKYKSRLAEPALAAVSEFGLPVININGPNQNGVSFTQSTTKDGFRVSTNSAYLSPIKDRKNIDLKINCHVTQVLISTNTSAPTANGVKFSCENGRNHTVFAKKEVILSAGAFNTPQILMLSGIGPKDHLEQLGVEVVKDLPVGNNYIDHVAVIGLQFIVDKPLLPPLNDDVYNGTGPLSIPTLAELLSFTDLENQIPTMEINFITAPAVPSLLNEEIYNKIYKPYENQPAFSMYAILLKPESRGFIRLPNGDPFAKPRIIPNYLSTTKDVDTLVKVVKQILAISQQPSLQKLGTRMLNGSLPNCNQYEYASDAYLRCYVKTMTLPGFHACCTCRMGPENDPTTVVDSELRVHGIKKLRIVDGSIMPDIISGHPNSGIVMIGEKAADMIKGT